MNTKKILEEFARENLSPEHAEEVLEILKDIPGEEAPEDKDKK